MKNLWFTSDHHFGHEKIRFYCERPFESVEEMNETMIANWNAVVGVKDTVYHLGDLFLCEVAEAKRIRNRLNGSICLIRGNHDKTAEQMRTVFEWMKDYYELKVEDKEIEDEREAGKQRIILCHYAFRVWNKSHRGSWHLYGHSHGGLPDDPNSLSFDIGVDCHGFRPISYEEVKVKMREKSG